MESTVDLHMPYTYPWWPVAAAGAIVVLLGVALAIWNYASRKKHKEKKASAPGRAQRNDIRLRYLKLIDTIGTKYKDGGYSERECYEQLSICVREFVKEATGINVTACTLSDIQKLRMPSLEALIREYYFPEFSDKTGFDADRAIEEAKRVVSSWN